MLLTCLSYSVDHYSDIKESKNNNYQWYFIRKMQIKTKMRLHLIPVAMTIVKKTKDDKYL
jgi:hypothetical protein